MASNENSGDPPIPPSASSSPVHHPEDSILHPDNADKLLLLLTGMNEFTNYSSWQKYKCGKKAAMKRCADTEASTSFPTQPPDQGDVTRTDNNIVDPTENNVAATNDKGVSQYNEFFGRIEYVKILNNSDDTTIQDTSTHSDTPVESLNVTTIQGTSTHSDTPVDSLNVTTIQGTFTHSDTPVESLNVTTIQGTSTHSDTPVESLNVTTIQGTFTHSDTPVESLNVTTIQGTSTHSDTPVESLNVTTIEEPIHYNDVPDDCEANSYDYLTSITDTLSNDDSDSDVEVISAPPPSATEGIVPSKPLTSIDNGASNNETSHVDVVSTRTSFDNTEGIILSKSLTSIDNGASNNESSHVDVVSMITPFDNTEGIVPSEVLTSITIDPKQDDESSDVDVVSIFSPSDNTSGVSFPNTNIVPTPSTQLNTLSTVTKQQQQQLKQQRLPPPSQRKRRFSPASPICDDSFKFSTSGSRTLVRPPRRKAVRAIRSCHRSSTESQSSVSSTLNNVSRSSSSKDDSLDFINELFNINQPTTDFVQNSNIHSPPSTPSPTITKRSNSQETIKDLPEPSSFQELLGTPIDESQRDIVESHVSTPLNTITPTTRYEPQACQEIVELIYDPQKEIEALTLAADTALEYFDSLHKPGLELAEPKEHQNPSSNQDANSIELNTTAMCPDKVSLSDALVSFDASKISDEDASPNMDMVQTEPTPDNAFNEFFPNTCVLKNIPTAKETIQHQPIRPPPPKIRRRETSIELPCEDSMKISSSGTTTLVRPPRRKAVKQSGAEAEHHTLSSNQDGKSTPPNPIDGNIDESTLQSSQIETPKQLNTTLKRSDGFTLSDALTLFDAGEISIEDASSNFVGIPVETLPDDVFNAFFPNTCAVTDNPAQHSRCRRSPPKIRSRATSIELDCEDSMKMSYSGSRTLVRPPRRKVAKLTGAEADAARSVIPSTTLPAVTIPTSATPKRIGLKPSAHTAPEITKGPERKQSISPPASRTPAPKASVTFRDSSKTSQSATSDIKAPMETPHSKDSITSKNNTKIPHPKNPASTSGTAGRSRTQDHSSSKKTQTVTKSDIMAVLGAYISHLTPPPLVTPSFEATTQQQKQQRQQQQQQRQQQRQQPPPANRETQQKSQRKEVFDKIVRDLMTMETDEQAELTRSLLKRKVCNEKTNDAKRIKLDHPTSPKIDNKSKSLGTKSPKIPVTQQNKKSFKSVQKDFSPKQKHSNATQITDIKATNSDSRNVTNETKETNESLITRTSSPGKQKEKESSRCEVKNKDNNNLFSKQTNTNKTPIIPEMKSSIDVEDVKTTKKSPQRGNDSKPQNKKTSEISDYKSKDSSQTSCSQHIHPSKSDKPKTTKSNSIATDTKNPTSEIKRKNTCPDFQPTPIMTNQEKEKSHKTDNKKRDAITKSSPIQRAEKSSKTEDSTDTSFSQDIPRSKSETPKTTKPKSLTIDNNSPVNEIKRKNNCPDFQPTPIKTNREKEKSHKTDNKKKDDFTKSSPIQRPGKSNKSKDSSHTSCSQHIHPSKSETPKTTKSNSITIDTKNPTSEIKRKNTCADFQPTPIKTNREKEKSHKTDNKKRDDITKSSPIRSPEKSNKITNQTTPTCDSVPQKHRKTPSSKRTPDGSSERSAPRPILPTTDWKDGLRPCPHFKQAFKSFKIPKKTKESNNDIATPPNNKSSTLDPYTPQPEP